jgi:hypothetical protein
LQTRGGKVVLADPTRPRRVGQRGRRLTAPEIHSDTWSGAIPSRRRWPARAAALLGAARALRDRTGATRPATDESSYTRQIHDLTETLGRAAFASAWQAGADRSDDPASDEEDY